MSDTSLFVDLDRLASLFDAANEGSTLVGVCPPIRLTLFVEPELVRVEVERVIARSDFNLRPCEVIFYIEPEPFLSSRMGMSVVSARNEFPVEVNQLRAEDEKRDEFAHGYLPPFIAASTSLFDSFPNSASLMSITLPPMVSSSTRRSKPFAS